MLVLVGCEESQAVCIEFRKRGHEAYSCDFKPCSGDHPEYHLQMDVYLALEGGKLKLQNGDFININKWDFTGLHPVCTKMTLSGNRTYAPGKPKHFERIEAVEWTIKLWQAACKKCGKVYMENPMGAMNGDKRLPKPQIVHPYYFGEEAMKTTCLWLYNLPKLYHNKTVNLFDDKVTHVGKGEMYEWVDSKTGKKKRMSMFHAAAKGFGKKQTSKDYSEVRSKTFAGIAEAMATQWG